MKRFLYLFIVIGTIALVALVGYFLYNRANSPSGEDTTGTGNLPSTPNQTSTKPATPLPQTGQGNLPATALSSKFGVVAETQAVDFYVDKENNALVVELDGQIVKITKGQASVLSSSVITGLISAKFSYDGKKILAIFGDLSNPQGSIFDVATKSWQPLQSGFASAAWSPSNYQIAYLKQSDDSASLGFLDASNANQKMQELIKLHAADIEVAWAGLNKIVLKDKNSSAIKSSVWTYDVKLKKMSLVLDGYLGLESIWNETSTNQGLFFSAGRNGYGGIISLVNATGNTVTRLKIATLPSKCAFGSEMPVPAQATSAASASSSKPVAAKAVDILYCGVPRNSSVFSSLKLPDEYEKRAAFTSDDIYKINLLDGSTSAVFNDQSQLVDVSHLKMFRQNLFFINRIDQKVYALSLK